MLIKLYLVDNQNLAYTVIIRLQFTKTMGLDVCHFHYVSTNSFCVNVTSERGKTTYAILIN